MARRALTAEELEARKAALVRGRATAAANRAARAEVPDQGEGGDLGESDPPASVEEPVPAGPISLTGDELASIVAEARKKVDAEAADVARLSKKELMARTLDIEILRQRREAGLTDYKDDLITFQVDVAPFSDGLRWDGVVYHHGTWITKPRHIYDSMREQMARSWDSEERAGNPNRKFRRESAGTMNPMLRERRLPDGTLTVGGDQRVHGVTGMMTSART